MDTKTGTTLKLSYAYASSRFAKTWTNSTITWKELTHKLAATYRTSETVAQFKTLSKARQDEIKDIGGFVGGHLKNGRRKKGACLNRSLITLDADYANSSLWDEIAMIHEWTACVYSTHKHTPEHPRLRLLFPLARTVSEDEYPAVARKIAEMLGIDYFDDTTYEPTRLMYWPSTPADGEYFFDCFDGALIDPDRILATYSDWRDSSTWPVSSRQTKALQARAAKQADPTGKPGIVGAFCRTYPIEDAIETFLKNVYVPSTIEGRYDYVPGESTAGVVTYDGLYSYSHHATDPASSQLVNAFDLVRIHRFHDLDETAGENLPSNRLPSYKAMCELAAQDHKVRETLAKERLQEAKTEFDIIDDNTMLDWLSQLEVKKNGSFTDSLPNFVKITENDPNLASIAFNLHRDGIDVNGKLPWMQLKPGWTDVDFSQLKAYIERVYKIYSPAKVKDAVQIAAAARAYHPVRDFLESLPVWDGVPRVDSLLIDFLNASDTVYTRAVTCKTLTAAVARIYQPGIKFDSMLILNGPQGIGKSTLFARLGGDWFTDALTLTDMRDKTAAEKLQGFWICEIAELAGMRKAEIETVKSFISRQDDKYRAAYGVNVESHLRQSIIVGSTNADQGFLRDITGNRRFWPVKVYTGAKYKPWNIDTDFIKQLWAEAKYYYRQKEPLYLSGEADAQALEAQSEAMETDEREGLVREYLDRPLPKGWYELSLDQRRIFLNNGSLSEFDGGASTVADRRRTAVSNIEIWAECFEKDPASIRPMDAYAISAILAKIEGWHKTGKRMRIKPYNMQRVWELDY